MTDETIVYLKENEVSRLMAHAKASSKRDFALFLVTLRHGLRSSEVCGLTTSSIDFDEKLIETRRLKKSSRCVQHLQADELRALKAWIKERNKRFPQTDALFPSERTGRALTRSGLLQLMRKYAKHLGFPKEKHHFHVLKHTCATQMLQNGGSIKYIQEWLGHKDIRNTCVYAKITPKGMDEESKRLFARMPSY